MSASQSRNIRNLQDPNRHGRQPRARRLDGAARSWRLSGTPWLAGGLCAALMAACSSGEGAMSCADDADCAEGSSCDAPSGACVDASEVLGESPAQTKVYLGFMVHLEDDWNDAGSEAEFRNHAEQLRYAASVFAGHGGKLTAESALPFARGCEIWGDNVLQELVDSSMGVGSHSNTTALYEETKQAVDALVGPENNRGISGGWGPQETADWAAEAAELGFEYVDAPVYFVYRLIPQEERPGQVSDEQIIDEFSHDPVPPEFSERIHPHRVESAYSFHVDTTGPVLLLTGSVGEMSSLHEGRSSCFPGCVFDEDDIDAFVSSVQEAVEISSPDELSVVYAHVPLHLFSVGNEPLFDRLFTALADLAEAGAIEYATQGEIYDRYRAWE